MKTIDSSPKKDHFRMPGEFSAHEGVYMLWPQRPDNWRDGGNQPSELSQRLLGRLPILSLLQWV